jgi:hypothetical protein
MLTNVMERERVFGHANELKCLSASTNAKGTCETYSRPRSGEGAKGIDGITRIPVELSDIKLLFGRVRRLNFLGYL